MSEPNKKELERAAEILRSGLRAIKPDLTDKNADNFIINVGNYLQLKRLNVSDS